MKAAVIMDIHGCPNRCRHCWLGHHDNADIQIEDFIRVAEQFKNYTKDGQPFFTEMLFNTWYREPDFSDNYRELWELENRLSTGKVPRFELASTWRLVRDPGYAPWLWELGVDCVQVTLFGTEKNTDYFKGRKGAFSESLEALNILLKYEIVPRIQIFPFSTTIEDIINLRKVLRDIRLEERINELGKEFTCFLNMVTPIGEGFNLEEIRPRKDDILRLPQYFIEKTLKHWKSESINHLWKTEAELLPSLLRDKNSLNENPHIPAFMVDSEFNVYPNCGEITAWWCLGNIRRDGVPAIIENYLTRNIPGLKMNYEIPVNYFARKFGNPAGDRIYVRNDLIQKWIRLEGMGGNIR